MVSLADSLVASSSRPLALRVRADLTARRQRYQGRSYWVVKEPIGLRYFRFQDEEYAVLQMLRDGISLEDIKEQFEREFAPHKITFQDLQQFIGTLHRSGLVISDAPGQGDQLFKRRNERTKKEFMSRMSNVLAIRFKGIDPERLLTWLYPVTKWAFHSLTVMFFVLLGTSALLLIAVQFDVFRSRLPAFQEFFGPSNWLYLGLVLGVTKVMHEFGHGLLCKRFGGECHEMGVMFLVLTPCLYCNVSDSWMLPSKWQRAAIGAGGIYVELTLATIATYVWWFSEPGMMNYLALRVMFICSVSTVIFNGNPLLRFDGYYILSDLVEIPNLRQKASKILQRLAGKHCLGLEMPEDPFLPQTNQGFFAMYTIAAVCYRWFVFCSILFFLNQVFEPYGLKILGQMIALMGLYGLIVQPLWQLVKFLHVPGRMDQVKWPRFFVSAAIVGSALAIVLLVPLPYNIKCAVTIGPQDAASIYVAVPGRLEELMVVPGQQVDQEQVLARLSNPDLEVDVHRLASEMHQYETELANLRFRRTADPEVRNQIGRVEELVLAKKLELHEKTEDERHLTLRSPRPGVVFSPPLRPERAAPDGGLASWSGSPFDTKNQNMHLQVSDLFCQIGDPQALEAVLAVDQADIESIALDQKVLIKLEALVDDTYEGRINEIAQSEMEIAPTSLTNQAGGAVATRTDAEGRARPLSTIYRARVPIENANGLVQLDYRGKAKIRVGYKTVGSRLWRYLARTFHFYM